MTKWTTFRNFGFLFLPCLFLMQPVFGEETPEELDIEATLEDPENLPEEEGGEEVEPGDRKEFTIVTDDNIATMRVGDVYKNNDTYFKVLKFQVQGKKGGWFVVQRIKGKVDPGRKWSRVTGEGPLTIAGRETLLDRFLKGGALMYPIALLFLVLIIGALNNFWLFRRGRQCPPKYVSQAREAIEAGDLAKFEELSFKYKGLFAGICRAMLKNYQTSTLADIKARCEAEAMRQIEILRAPLKSMNFIAAVAPLLGLLGTVLGIMGSFESLEGEAASAAKAQAMAAGIKMALITTAAGLTVAVPALFVYFFFNQRFNTIIADSLALSEEFIQALGMLGKHGVPAASQPAPVSDGVKELVPISPAAAAKELKSKKPKPEKSPETIKEGETK